MVNIWRQSASVFSYMKKCYFVDWGKSLGVVLTGVSSHMHKTRIMYNAEPLSFAHQIRNRINDRAEKSCMAARTMTVAVMMMGKTATVLVTTPATTAELDENHEFTGFTETVDFRRLLRISAFTVIC